MPNAKLARLADERRATRKALALRHGNKPSEKARLHKSFYSLDPVTTYKREQYAITRLIARWIKKRRYCPKIDDILIRKPDWPRKAVEQHIADLMEGGYARFVGGRGIDLTSKGWYLTPYEPEKASLPSDDRKRAEIKRTLRYAEKLKGA